MIGWIIFAVVWLGCGILAFGMSLAFWTYEYSMLTSKKNFREDLIVSLAVSTLGPLSLISVYIATDRAKHGLIYRKPTITEIIKAVEKDSPDTFELWIKHDLPEIINEGFFEDDREDSKACGV